MSGSSGAASAAAAIVEGGGDADDVLRAVVAALVEHGACSWAGLFFVEGDEFVLGPEAGVEAPGSRRRVPVEFQGTRVAELAGDEAADPAVLAGIAALIAPYCLVGWDTGGVPWDTGL